MRPWASGSPFSVVSKPGQPADQAVGLAPSQPGPRLGLLLAVMIEDPGPA